MFIRSILFLIAAVFATSLGFGDDTSSGPQKAWSNAKTTYAGELEKLRQTVVEYLAGLDKKAREAGDFNKVKQIKVEQDAFEERNELPKNFDGSTYARKQKTAQEDLRKSQKVLLTFYLKERKDNEAQDLELELAELLKGEIKKQLPSPAPATPSRWLNTSYDSTLYLVSGKQWAEMDNKTKTVKWHLEEIRRDQEFIELFLPVRQQTYRLSSQRLDLKDGANWKWLSDGYWIDSPTSSKSSK